MGWIWDMEENWESGKAGNKEKGETEWGTGMWVVNGKRNRRQQFSIFQFAAFRDFYWSVCVRV